MRAREFIFEKKKVQQLTGVTNIIARANQHYQDALLAIDHCKKSPHPKCDQLGFKAKFFAKELKDLQADALLAKKQLRAELKTARESGITAQRALMATFMTNVRTLAQRYDAMAIPSPEELKAMKKAERAPFINSAKFTKEVTAFLTGFFLDHIYDAKDLTEEQVTHFINGASSAEGVLNMPSMVEVDRGFMSDHVNPAYKVVWDIVIHELLQWKQAKTGGSIGPAEMAIAMLGTPADKAKVGDIDVAGVMYEIKAGETSGGRLNSKNILTGKSGWPEWTAGIEKIVKRYAKGNYDFPEGAADPKGYSERERPVKKNGKKGKEASKYNLNMKGIERLNTEVLGPYSNFNMTYELLANTLKEIIINLKDIKDHEKYLANMIVRNTNKTPEQQYLHGTINLETFFKSYTYLAYESYRMSDGQTETEYFHPNDHPDEKLAGTVRRKRKHPPRLYIIFINTSVANEGVPYTIIRNSKDLMNKLNTPGGVYPSGGAVTWNDDQQKSTPQYLVNLDPY